MPKKEWTQEEFDAYQAEQDRFWVGLRCVAERVPLDELRRLEALRLAVGLDRSGKPAQRIVEQAQEFYEFLRS